jgi:hypothetical protein
MLWRWICLGGCCAVIVSVAVTGLGAAAVGTAPSLGVSATRITLNGKPFFPMIADEYTLPNTQWVADVSALGTNTLFMHDHGCPDSHLPGSVPGFPSGVHAVLKGSLFWLVTGECVSAASIPEAVQWPDGIVGITNPAYGSCSRLPKFLGTLGVYNAVLGPARSKPVVWNTWIANELVPGRKWCLTAPKLRALFWSVVAAGGSGLEYYAFVPARNTNTGLPDTVSVDPDVVAASATFSTQLAVLKPAILAAPRIAGSGVASPTVRYGSWTAGRATYIVAVNTAQTKSAAVIKVGGTKASVLFESRALKVTGGQLRDSFAPLAVHIYTASG